MRHVILSDKFVESLREAGIIHEYERTSRVIIDAKVGEPIRLYVCRFGDERLIDVVDSGGVELVTRT